MRQRGRHARGERQARPGLRPGLRPGEHPGAHPGGHPTGHRRPGLHRGWLATRQLPLLHPGVRDLGLIGGGQLGRGGVIQCRGTRPVVGLGVQIGQEARGIGRVGGGIERLLQAGEGIRMVHQVDLHAADVDRADATGLQPPRRGDRLLLGVVEAALPFGIDGPGPGRQHAAGRIAPAALDPADRRQELRRQGAGPLGGNDRGAAQRAWGEDRDERRGPGRPQETWQQCDDQCQQAHGGILEAKAERKVAR